MHQDLNIPDWLSMCSVVPHLSTHLHHPHAGGWEVQSHVHRANRHRPCTFRCRNCRRLLHRGVSQSCTIVWPMCCWSIVSRLSLDLLVGASVRSITCCGLLPLCEVLQLWRCESGARQCRRWFWFTSRAKRVWDAWGWKYPGKTSSAFHTCGLVSEIIGGIW